MSALTATGISTVQPLQQNMRTESSSPESGEADIGKRFEQMLWAEMLTHAGLEKSLTSGGGEAASAFSRYIVEAIAEDIAENHPLGFADQIELDPSKEVVRS